jgi:hypothetical protein
MDIMGEVTSERATQKPEYWLAGYIERGCLAEDSNDSASLQI